MQYHGCVTWFVEVLDARVQDELEALPPDMKARFRRIVELIQGHGLDRMREPHVKHLEGPLWEMRMKGQDGHFTGDLCYCQKPPRCRGSGVYQEDPENAAPGNRSGIGKS